MSTPFNGNPAMSLGKIIHSVIEGIHLEQIDEKTIDTASFQERVEVATSSEDNVGGVLLDDDLLIQMQDTSLNAIREWWDVFGKDSKPVETEKELVMEFNGPGCNGVPVLGYADLIHEYEGELELVDYKTTGRVKSQNDVDESLQLWLYSVMTGIRNTAIVSIVRPANQKKWGPDAPIKVDIKRHRVTEEQLMHAKSIVYDVAAGIEAMQFSACLPGSWNCTKKWCDFFEACRGEIK